MRISGVIIILLLAIVIVGFIIWARIPDIVASSLSKKMQVTVEIEDINLTLQSIKVEKLEIGNPKGSILSKAFSSDQILIQAPASNYFKDEIVIDEIDIDKVYVALEFDSKGSSKGNWSTIMGNMKSSSPPSKNEKNILIKRLILTNIDLDLVYRNEGGKVQKLPPIRRLEFTNVTSQGGIPSQQIMNVILKETLRSIFQKENLQNMLEGILENPKGGVQQLLEPFKGLLNLNDRAEEENHRAAS